MPTVVESLFQRERPNAVVSWALVGFFLLAAVTSTLRGDSLWAAFAVVVAVLAILPPLAMGSPTSMLPWEVTALTALPLLGRSVATLPLTDSLATYLSVAAIALVVAAELHLFTPVRMNDGFAVLFVVVTTMATAGVWAVLRWASDALLGTGYLLAVGSTGAAIERAVMIEFVASAAAGLLAGIVFAFYVRRQVSAGGRYRAGAVE